MTRHLHTGTFLLGNWTKFTSSIFQYCLKNITHPTMKPKTASPPEDHRISAIALQFNLFWLSPKFTFFLHLRDCNGLPWTWPLSNNENVLPISFTHKICWIYSCLIYPRFKRQHGACGKRNYTWPSWGQIGVKLNQRHAINDMIKSQWKVMGGG